MSFAQLVNVGIEMTNKYMWPDQYIYNIYDQHTYDQQIYIITSIRFKIWTLCMKRMNNEADAGCDAIADTAN